MQYFIASSQLNVNTFVDYILIKAGVNCRAGHVQLETVQSVNECSAACSNIAGCEFFIYHVEGEYCYWIKTSTASCPEGFDRSSYNFYGLIRGKFSAF